MCDWRGICDLGTRFTHAPRYDMKKAALICGIVGSAVIGWKIRSRSPSFECSLHAQQQYAEADTHVSNVWREGQGRRCIESHNPKWAAAVERSLNHVKRLMLEQGVPGAVLAISKDGKLLCSVGLGYSDVENGVPCTPQTVMRVASISKAMTSVALMWERGKVGLDAPVQKYVPYFPEKELAGKPVVVTARQLLTHTAGIRHYTKDATAATLAAGTVKDEFKQAEYYIKDHYDSVKDSIQIFANDNLLHEPGKRFFYTTHAWTLISAIIEGVSGKNFLDYMNENIFQPLGMSSTFPEVHTALMYGRSRHYCRTDDGTLLNTAYVDNSYKWAGGGFVSNAEDLVKFGNAVLACHQLEEKDGGSATAEQLRLPAQRPALLLQPKTVATMWTPVVSMGREDLAKCQYGLGWFVIPRQEGMVRGKETPFSAGHAGAAVGTTSALVVIPSSREGGEKEAGGQPPRGVVVAVIFNLQGVKHVYKLGLKIAEEFVY